jgi:glycosyltransferase involved in cell wall biosynthesis
MRVLLVNYEYPPVGAGAATATKAIAQAMVASGHSATVLTTGFGDLVGTCSEDGVRVIRVASRRRRREAASISEMLSFMFHGGRAIRHIVRSENIEGMIAFFSIPCGPLAAWAHTGTGVPFIVSLRGGDVPGAESGLGLIHFILAPLRRWILRAARAVVANSRGLKELSETKDRVAVFVIPNGVDTSFFVPARKTRVAGTPTRLLFVGRFQPQKNLLWLLDQIAQVSQESDRPFILEIVGDGPQKAALLEKVRDLNLTENVLFHGWEDRTTLRVYYQKADLVINPSLYEGMPNVVLEAMACGCPILASRVPGNDSVVMEGITGWLFDLGNSDRFREQLCDVLNHPEVANGFGVAGRMRAESEYSWAKATESYLELFGYQTPVSTFL